MIGSQNRTTYDDLVPFFGETASGKARLFITLNYKGSKYNESINTRENPETIKAEPLWQLMLAKNYDDDIGSPVTPNDNVISSAFVNFIKNVAIFHKTLDTLNAPTYKILANKKVSHLYENWDKLTQDAREFYTQNTNFVSHLVSNSNSVQDPTSGMNLKQLRLNLKKVDGVKSNETIFGGSLPYLPKGCILQDGSGVELDVNFLHQLYEQTLDRTTPPQFGGAIPGLDAWQNDAKLNLDRFLRNCLFTHDQVQRGVIKVAGELADVYDIGKEIYSRDNEGKLLKNGAVVASNTAAQFTRGVPDSSILVSLKVIPVNLPDV